MDKSLWVAVFLGAGLLALSAFAVKQGISESLAKTRVQIKIYE